MTVEGQAYEAEGVGWIDHQSLARHMPEKPPPPVVQPELSGWNWCQFNFDNGEAFTAAAFQTGAIGTGKLIPTASTCAGPAMPGKRTTRSAPSRSTS